MDLNFSGAEVTVIAGLLGSMVTGMGFLMRQLLAAKQETITQQRDIIAKQDGIVEQAIKVTAELRDVVREQNGTVERLGVKVTDLLRELTDRRQVVNEAAALWIREHGGRPYREDR